MSDISYIDEKSTFSKKIESDYNICSSCYRKLRERYEPHPSLPEVVGAQFEYNSDAGFAYFDDFKDSGRPSVGRTYCVCGVVEWNDAKIRPMTEEEMWESSERISQHLSEKGVVHDEGEFFYAVNELYDLPEYQNREEKVFEEAIERAISVLYTEEETR